MVKTMVSGQDFPLNESIDDGKYMETYGENDGKVEVEARESRSGAREMEIQDDFKQRELGISTYFNNKNRDLAGRLHQQVFISRLASGNPTWQWEFHTSCSVYKWEEKPLPGLIGRDPPNGPLALS